MVASAFRLKALTAAKAYIANGLTQHIVLPPYRMLMVWVYDCTDSLLMAMLMHASLIPSIFFVLQPLATGWACVAYYLVLAATLRGIVAVVAVVQQRAA